MSPTVKRRFKKFLLWTEILLILVLGAGMGVVLGAFYQVHKMLPPDEALDLYRPPVGSKIYSNDGVLLAKLATEDRDPVPLSRVPKHMRDAMVAIEDSRFYQHRGLDFRGLARSLWANIHGGELAQGGSTITQQLARNMFLNQKKKLSRKIKEALLAVQIERNWTKNRILEAYLNQVYFGSGAYGISSASKTYFGKRVEDLTLEEAALLAGLPQRPSEFSPYANHAADGTYDRALRRRNMVLDRMAELKFIPVEKAEAAKKKPVKVAKEKPRTSGFMKAKYFVQYALDQLKLMGYDEESLQKAGYTIITTLNWKMQQAADKAARNGIQKWRRAGRVTEAALVCIDPTTGYIRSMVGGVNQPWEKYQFNCAAQAMRQPGSSFKAFVYAAAMEQGDTAYSSVASEAQAVKDGNGRMFAPKNHGKYGGPMSYTSAFAASSNGAAWNVGLKVGPKKVKEMAQRLGLKGDLRAYPSISLGASEATVLEMASAYSTFAAKGRRAEPMAILQIRDADKTVLEEVQPRIYNNLLKPSTVENMDILTRAVVTSGTGRPAGVVPNAHGKTGTSENYTDAWFVGYTPDLVTAVWCGNRNNSEMAHLYGGTISCPIWAEFMQQAVELNPAKKKKPIVAKASAKPKRPRALKAPQPISDVVSADSNDRNRISCEVCTESGFLATEFCPGRVTNYYLLGQHPRRRCPLHQTAEAAAHAQREKVAREKAEKKKKAAADAKAAAEEEPTGVTVTESPR